MSQESALLDADTGEEQVETQDAVPETDDVAPAETEIEDEEPTEPDVDDEDAEEEPEPSVDEILARDDIDDEEFDRLTEKFPGLKKKLEWRQAQARDAATQSARSEAAKKEREETARKYANGQLAQDLAQFMSSVIENGDEPDANTVQQKLAQAARSLNEYHFQQNMVAFAEAVDRAVPEGGEIPRKAMEKLSTATNKLQAGEISHADWIAARLEAFAEQYVSAKEEELKKKWRKEETERRKSQKETERLKNSDAKRKSGTSPTTANGSPGGDNPESVLDDPNASRSALKAAWKSAYGFDISEILPGAKG